MTHGNPRTAAMTTQTPQFLSVHALAEKYRDSGFTEAGIRWQLFNREHNGLNKAVIRIGKKLLVDEIAFVGWLRSQREAA